MQLEQFLNSCAYACLIDDEFQATCELAGINWQTLPPFDGVRAMQKYYLLRETHSHQEARFEVRDDARFLEISADTSQLGRDEFELSVQFKKIHAIYAYEALGQELIANPSHGKALIENFTTGDLKRISASSVLEFAPPLFEEFLEKAKKQEGKVLIPGFPMLSEMIGGFNPKRILMIMGETGFGKTNLALALAIRASLRSRCLYVNMEMSLDDMTKRLAVMVTRKSYHDLYRGHIEYEEFKKLVSVFGGNLVMTPGSSLSMGSIEALIRRESREGMKFAIIDYDQKIDLPLMKNEPEWRSLQKAIIKLEDLAKELDICIIVLMQQNRDGQISASHRATFAAHTILDFKNDPMQGPIIHAKKNRHGKKDQAVRVEYGQDDSSIIEIEVVTHVPPKTEGKQNARTV